MKLKRFLLRYYPPGKSQSVAKYFQLLYDVGDVVMVTQVLF